MHITNSQRRMEKTRIMEKWYGMLPVFEYKAQEMYKVGVHAVISAAAILGLTMAGHSMVESGGVYP